MRRGRRIIREEEDEKEEAGFGLESVENSNEDDDVEHNNKIT